MVILYRLQLHICRVLHTFLFASAGEGIDVLYADDLHTLTCLRLESGTHASDNRSNELNSTQFCQQCLFLYLLDFEWDVRLRGKLLHICFTASTSTVFSESLGEISSHPSCLQSGNLNVLQIPSLCHMYFNQLHTCEKLELGAHFYFYLNKII